MKGRGVSALSGEYLEIISRRLKELYIEIGALSVVLVDTMGQIIAQVGDSRELDITTVVSLLAASFSTTSEMSRRLREKRRTFNLTYHEGQEYDVYASNVASGLFLIMIFDRGTYVPRIGTVWLCLKRSIQDLRRIAVETDPTKPKETLAPDFAESLREKLDSLFQDESPAPVKGDKLDRSQVKDLTHRPAESQQKTDERKI